MIRIDAPKLDEVIEGLKLLSLTPPVRRRLLQRMARLAMYQAVENVKDQKDVDGRAFTPRAPRGRGAAVTRPMLAKMVRSKWMAVFSSPEMAQVYFRNRMIRKGTPDQKTVNQAFVASRHQHGSVEEFFRAKIDFLFRPGQQNPKSREYWTGFCSEEQAKWMVACGFPGKVESIKGKVPVRQGYYYMKHVKPSWNVKIPARPFLGANQKQQAAWGELLLRDIGRRFKIKNYRGILS